MTPIMIRNQKMFCKMTKLIQSRPLLDTARRVPEPCYAPLNAIVHLFPVSPEWSRLRDSVPAPASLPLPRRWTERRFVRGEPLPPHFRPPRSGCKPPIHQRGRLDKPAAAPEIS